MEALQSLYHDFVNERYLVSSSILTLHGYWLLSGNMLASKTVAYVNDMDYHTVLS